MATNKNMIIIGGCGYIGEFGVDACIYLLPSVFPKNLFILLSIL